MTRFLLFVALSISFSCSAQDFLRRYDIPVTINDQQLPNAWAGGLNSAQFSKADLDFDGDEDLVVFDRIGNRLLTYLYQPTEPHYVFTRSLNQRFPTGLQNWVLMHDYNCDGKKDIFTNYQSGVLIFKNVGDATNGLSFEPVNNGNLIPAFYNFGASSFNAPIYTIGIDIPAINDYDGDGDMDIFSYNELGTTVYWFKCLSIENGNCDIPSYQCVNRCYGQYGEASESFIISYGDNFSCDFNVANPREAGERLHIGSSLLQLELDNNGVPDMVVGDVSNKNLLSLQMADAADGQDSVIIDTHNFPWNFGNSDSIYIDMFPAAFYEDVDNDGLRDLIASPNATAQAQDKNSVWWFRNTGTNTAPSFQLMQTDFLQETQIDLGWGAYPAAADVNGDGLMDLVVGNRVRFESGVVYTSRLAVFLNTGSAAAPQFELMNDNWLDIPAAQLKAIYPCFGDIDADGDVDALLGDEDGYFYLYTNTAGSGNMMNLQAPENKLRDNGGVFMDVGQNAAPQLVDIDDDGDLDLIAGEKNGSINFFRNIGSAQVPSFSFVEDTLGGVVAANYLGINGYSTPHFYKSTSGDWQLMLGSEKGIIAYYDQISNNLSGDFQLINAAVNNINEGDRSAFCRHDFNNDGLADLIVGQCGGGLGYYSGLPVGVKENDIAQVRVFPNPANDMLVVEWPSKEVYSLFDMTGREVMRGTLNEGKTTISTAALNSGMYILRVGAVHTARVMVRH